MIEARSAEIISILLLVCEAYIVFLFVVFLASAKFPRTINRGRPKVSDNFYLPIGYSCFIYQQTQTPNPASEHPKPGRSKPRAS